MIDYASFKKGVENLLDRKVSNDEMIDLCGIPLMALLKETVEKGGKSKHAQNRIETKN